MSLCGLLFLWYYLYVFTTYHSFKWPRVQQTVFWDFLGDTVYSKMTPPFPSLLFSYYLGKNYLCNRHISKKCFADRKSTTLNLIDFSLFCFVFLNLRSAPCAAGPPPPRSAVLDQTCHPRRCVTKAVGLIILPGSLCSYFYIPFCCLPFSRQQNTSDWCSACDLSSHSILHCSAAA